MSKESSGLFEGTSGSRLRTSAGSSSTNKFSDKTTWPSTLEDGKQGKHIEGHPNYVPGKSKLTITMEEASELAKKFSGTGTVLGNPSSSSKEWVDFGKIIGMWIDEFWNEHPTTKGVIHHSKKGTHIVPANHDGDY